MSEYDLQPDSGDPQKGQSAVVSRSSLLMIALVVLLGLLILEPLAERIQFAITRGDQRAKAEIARGQLVGMTDSAGRFRLVAKSIGPSVVGIDTVRVESRPAVRDEWFGSHKFESQGQGSGVIVSDEGYVVTNFHVIDQASRVVVELSDGRTTSDVEVIGADPYTDLAVLKIDAGDVLAAPWGDSDELQVGDEVLAVGSPFGLAQTVTAGIVSAKERPAVTSAGYQEFLQTDAAVNPGNSGGPLVNLKGEVVGINTAIIGQSYQGVSFAIPSRLAREVYEKLLTQGTIDRGWFGVAMSDVNEKIAKQLGLDELTGAVVLQVVPDSPAERAGIESGDVITSWNGLEIEGQTELSRAVARTEIGSEVAVVFIRDNQREELTVKVGRRPVQLGR